MSRKFIAAVLAASVAITGFSAAPSRAAEARDVAKVLGAAAVLYMIGKAVSEARDDQKDGGRASVHRADPMPYMPRPYRPAPTVSQPRGVLPGSCLRELRGERGQVMLRSCLRGAAVRTEALPDRCGTKVRIHGDKERAYSAQCLSSEGWRIVGRGQSGRGAMLNGRRD